MQDLGTKTGTAFHALDTRLSSRVAQQSPLMRVSRCNSLPSKSAGALEWRLTFHGGRERGQTGVPNICSRYLLTLRSHGDVRSLVLALITCHLLSIHVETFLSR